MNERGINPTHQKPRVEFDRETLDRVSELAEREAGLYITPSKASLVRSRLSKIIRTTGHQSISEYITDLTESPDPESIKKFISALTTNVSSFYRESHHFEIFSEQISKLSPDQNPNGKPIRVWSAGCSSGQEPYSIAITIAEGIPNFKDLNIKVLCSDIDIDILKQAKIGRYTEKQLESLPNHYIDKYMKKCDSVSENYIFCQELRNMLYFRELNLLGNWPFSKKFDTIFCRNVMIYFSEDNQEVLSRRFCNALTQDGLLFVGHSERVSRYSEFNVTPSGITTYQRTR